MHGLPLLLFVLFPLPDTQLKKRQFYPCFLNIYIQVENIAKTQTILNQIKNTVSNTEFPRKEFLCNKKMYGCVNRDKSLISAY